jgi:hypothetical protein
MITIREPFLAVTCNPPATISSFSLSDAAPEVGSGLKGL